MGTCAEVIRLDKDSRGQLRIGWTGLAFDFCITVG